MHARTTRMIASVDSRIEGSGTFSTRTSPAPYIIVARISSLPSLILVVGHFFEPLDGLAMKSFLNRDVRHRRRGRGPVPMFLVRPHGDDVARTDLFNRSAPALVQPAPG